MHIRLPAIGRLPKQTTAIKQPVNKQPIKVASGVKNGMKLISIDYTTEITRNHDRQQAYIPGSYQPDNKEHWNTEH